MSDIGHIVNSPSHKLVLSPKLAESIVLNSENFKALVNLATKVPHLARTIARSCSTRAAATAVDLEMAKVPNKIGPRWKTRAG